MIACMIDDSVLRRMYNNEKLLHIIVNPFSWHNSHKLHTQTTQACGTSNRDIAYLE